jgi:SAM-dependent methyltransferase
MNTETQKMIKQLGPHNLKALEISGQHWKEQHEFKEYKSVHYPDFDICNDVLPELFDIIFAEQVFEHLTRPYQAARNVYSMLEDGGHFLITTPFLLRVHNEPNDCTRWTEEGIRFFLAECGFNLDRIHAGSWGNRACVIANFGDWMRYRPKLHSLANEPDFPVVVWALAKK